MKRLRRGSVAIGIVVGLMMVSGLAVAAVGEDDDTNLVVGYDGDGVLIYGVSAIDDEATDCAVEGDWTVTYHEETIDGKVPTQLVTSVVDGEGNPLTFGDGEVPYSPDGDCVLTGASIAGKKGQVNHGKFVSAMAKLIDGPKGCVMREIAKLDLGKTEETKVRPKDVEEAPEVEQPAEDPTVTFVTIGATCEKGNKDKNKDKDNPGQLKKAEREGARAAGAAPGNSGNAPGKNKDK